jgi:hypothetical protein
MESATFAAPVPAFDDPTGDLPIPSLHHDPDALDVRLIVLDRDHGQGADGPGDPSIPQGRA